jgi:hypothetical protein
MGNNGVFDNMQKIMYGDFIYQGYFYPFLIRVVLSSHPQFF